MTRRGDLAGRVTHTLHQEGKVQLHGRLPGQWPGVMARIVFFRGNGFQVKGIPAGPDSTAVMDITPLVKWANQCVIQIAMRRYGTLVTIGHWHGRQRPVAIMGTPARPEPTPRGRINHDQGRDLGMGVRGQTRAVPLEQVKMDWYKGRGMRRIRRSHGACPLLTGGVVSATEVSHHPRSTNEYANYNTPTVQTPLSKCPTDHFVPFIDPVERWRGLAPLRRCGRCLCVHARFVGARSPSRETAT
jgi:hypothetical protein